jgi:hypothetical protein
MGSITYPQLLSCVGRSSGDPALNINMVLMYIKNVFSASINGSPGEDAFQQAYPCKLDHTSGMRKELW